MYSQCLVAFLQAVAERETLPLHCLSPPRRREVRREGEIGREDRAERRGSVSDTSLLFPSDIFPISSEVTLTRHEQSTSGFSSPRVWLLTTRLYWTLNLSARAVFLKNFLLEKRLNDDVHIKGRDTHDVIEYNLWYLNVLKVAQTWHLTDFYQEALSSVAQGHFPRSSVCKYLGLNPVLPLQERPSAHCFLSKNALCSWIHTGMHLLQDAKEKQD